MSSTASFPDELFGLMLVHLRKYFRPWQYLPVGLADGGAVRSPLACGWGIDQSIFRRRLGIL